MKILITGGAGYVGSLLTPTLLAQGHDVTVLDWFLYGNALTPHPRLRIIPHKVRDLTQAMVDGHEAVLHLACISNDPSFALNPALGEADLTSTQHLVFLAQHAGVQRFIYASSSSVYGAYPEDVEVTEDLPLHPQTGYSTIKAKCEDVVHAANGAMVTTALRPATVCGYAPRLRLDVVVNAFTAQAYFNKQITVDGGNQYRSHLHIRDMVRAYIKMLEAPVEKIAGQVFNVSHENITILDLAQRVQAIAGGDLQIATDAIDQRSYRLNTRKIIETLGFLNLSTVEEAIEDLAVSFKADRVPNAMTDPIYYNVKQIQACPLS